MSPAPQPDPGEVLLWAFLRMLFCFVLGAASAALMLMLSSAVNALFLLVPVAYFIAPVIAYVMSLKRLTPEKSKGFGIGLALFVGLSLLLPVVICGGMLASSR